MFHATLHVLRFELLRTLTIGRMGIWLALCLFPAALVATLRYQSRGELPDEAVIVVCFALVPQISCMLGLLLWATPAIGSELESQSWIPIVLRAQGRVGIALGKFLTAVLWTVSYGMVSAALVTWFSGVDDRLQLLVALIGLVVLSCLGYAALYLLIGATFFRRATVVAVVYSFVLEGLISFVPATVNQVTISYRLRTLLADWTIVDRVRSNPNTQMFLGQEAVWLNVSLLLLYSTVLLALSVLMIRTREYPVQTEV